MTKTKAVAWLGRFERRNQPLIRAIEKEAARLDREARTKRTAKARRRA